MHAQRAVRGVGWLVGWLVGESGRGWMGVRRIAADCTALQAWLVGAAALCCAVLCCKGECIHRRKADATRRGAVEGEEAFRRKTPKLRRVRWDVGFGIWTVLRSCPSLPK